MTLTEYFRGRALTLRTKLPADEAARRIDAAALSVLSPFAYGIVGWARSGMIRLRYRRGAFAYSGKPILAGTLAQDGQGTRLDLVYRGPWAIRIAAPIWYVVFALGFVMVFFAGKMWTMGPAMWLPFLIVPILVLVAVPYVHLWAIRRADEELVLLVDFLRKETGATGAEAVVESMRGTA